MNAIEHLALALILLAVLMALVRLFLGPTTPDRVVAADSLAVITTPSLAWLAAHLHNGIYLDITLVYGALAFVMVVAIARALEGPRP